MAHALSFGLFLLLVAAGAVAQEPAAAELASKAPYGELLAEARQQLARLESRLAAAVGRGGEVAPGPALAATREALAAREVLAAARVSLAALDGPRARLLVGTLDPVLRQAERPWGNAALERLYRLVAAARPILEAAAPSAGSGPQTLGFDVPDNDACTAPIDVALGDTVEGQTAGGSNDGSATCEIGGPAKDVWYRFVNGPGVATVNFNTLGTQYDTVLSAHTSCPGTTSNEIACNDDFGDSPQSALSMALSGGQTVFIRVGGSNDESGSFDLQVTEAAEVLGTVTDAETLAAISGATVTLSEVGLGFIVEQTTAGDGSYGFLLPPRSVFADAEASSYVDQVHDGLDDTSAISGDPIAAGPGVPEAVDLALVPKGTVSGTVRTSDGVPVDGASVQATPAFGTAIAVSSDTDGTYQIEIKPGPVHVVAFPPFAATDRISEVYDNVPCTYCDLSSLGDQVVVLPGQDTPGIDFSLDPAGGFSGTVTEAAGGTPLEDATVYPWVSGFGFRNPDTTDASGDYEIRGLGPGSYSALALPPDGENLVSELFDSIPCPIGGYCIFSVVGTPISVFPPFSTANKDFALDTGGGFNGTVVDNLMMPVASMTVQVFDDSGASLGSTFTDGAGDYEVLGLPTGLYYAQAVDTEDLLIDEVYDDEPCPGFDCDPTPAGDLVAVNAGSVFSGIDFGLARGAAIIGHVTRQGAGTPLLNQRTRVYDASGLEVASARTDAEGRYLVGGLLTGSHTLKSNDFGSPKRFVSVLYGGQECEPGCDETGGDPVAVSGTSTELGIDMEKPTCGVPVTLVLVTRVTEATLAEACRFISLRGGFQVLPTGQATLITPVLEMRDGVAIRGELAVRSE